MAAILDTEAGRVVPYLLAAILCAALGWRERRLQHRGRRDVWPPFWFLSAVFLLVPAAGHVGLGEIVADLGRRAARRDGWYQARRGLQALAVCGIAATWGIGVLVAIWGAPDRRRRYLPSVMMLSGLLCFAAIRLISLHQVDTLLYRRSIAGVRFVVIVESVAMALFLYAAVRSQQHDPLHESGDVHAPATSDSLR